MPKEGQEDANQDNETLKTKKQAQDATWNKSINALLNLGKSLLKAFFKNNSQRPQFLKIKRLFSYNK